MLFYVYIIQSQKDDSFYIGSTGDLKDRVARHNAGRSRYTKTKLPWELVYYEEFRTKSEALKRENQIKRRKSKDYITKLIEEFSHD